MTSYRVFLTDGVMRRTLAATRALGSTGHRITVGEESRFNTSFLSRYCDTRVLYPSPRHKPERFIEFLVETLRRDPHDVLLPMESDTLDLVLRHRAAFEGLVRLPFVDMPRYLTFRDKRRMVQLAEEMGIPQPATVWPDDPAMVVHACRDLRYPLVIKPRHGWGSRGITVVDTPEELRSAYRELHQEDPLPIVQERIPPGPKFHTCALFGYDHEPRALTVHQELRNHPAPMGPSTAQRTVEWPELLEHTTRLLRTAGWIGVAGVDFVVDPRSGRPLFMEVNPRFWGPLQASIQAGVNFPELLVRMAMGEDLPPPPPYRLGEVTRAMLPYDLMNFIASPERFRMEPSFFQFRGPNVGYDILSTRDPWPTAGFFLTVLRYLNDPEVWVRQARLERVGRWLARRKGNGLADVAAISRAEPVGRA